VHLWQRKPALAVALDARIDALQDARLAALRQYLRGKAPMAAARLVHIARRSTDVGEARKAAETILRIVGAEAPTPRGTGNHGPRIVIERAVLALRDEPSTVVYRPVPPPDEAPDEAPNE
jgi:hypothetical protein